MRPLTVAHFDNAEVRGGAEEHILTLLRGLDRRRFRPLLVCTPQTAAKLGPDVPGDVAVVPLRLQRLRDLGPAFRLARLLRESGPPGSPSQEASAAGGGSAAAADGSRRSLRRRASHAARYSSSVKRT